MREQLKTVFEGLAAGRDLTREQSRWTFSRIMAGDLNQAQIGALLGAILVKGESVEELVGAAEAMREAAVRVKCVKDCIDTCGTGGDGISTFNVSTTAAIIAASAGATVAKHGNRSTTRVSGSTDVLVHLGIDVDASPDVIERCLREVGIGYLNARQLHPAMRFASPVRQSIPAGTIFNLLGPLTNPAGARRHVLGVPRLELLEKMALSLQSLGVIHAWVVHGSDGLCDLTITGPTTVVEIHDKSIRRMIVTPEDVGLPRATLDALTVDSPKESAQAVIAILDGEKGPRRDHALLNAAAALVVAGLAESLGDGVTRAAQCVDDGAAKRTLVSWQSIGGTASDRIGRQVEK